MWRYHCVLLFWSYAVVLTESTVWINYFCTWCARFAYAQLWWAISYFSMYIINTSSHDFSCAIWNKQALVNFSKIKNLSVSKKIYSCLFIANCTRNHVITYTNCTLLSPITWVKMFTGHISFFMGRSTFFINDVQER